MNGGVVAKLRIGKTGKTQESIEKCVWKAGTPVMVTRNLR
jgi:hypothetical protein